MEDFLILHPFLLSTGITTTLISCKTVITTEEKDREAQAHTAILFLAPLEKYSAALGPDSLAPLSKLHCKYHYLYKKIWGHPGLAWCWPGNLKNVG